MDLLSITYVTKDWAVVCMILGGVLFLGGILSIFVVLDGYSKKAWIVTGALFVVGSIFIGLPDICGNGTAIEKQYYVFDKTQIDDITKDAYKYSFDNKILTIYIDEGE